MSSAAAVQLADDYWLYHRGSAQLWNIDRGDVDQVEHWEDLSPAGVAGRVTRLADFAERAAELGRSGPGRWEIGRSELDDRARSLLAAVEFSARAGASILPYARDVTLVAGAINMAAFLTVMVPGYALTTREHGQGYITKLRSSPAFIDGWIAGLREGLGAGRCATARGIMAAIAELDTLLDTDPAHDPLVQQSSPTEMSVREAERWRAEIVDCVRHSVRPALVRLRLMLRDVALPGARPDDRPGICHSAGGAGDYQALLRASTSTELTAEQVHEVGRVQLALLDEEYRVRGAAALELADPVELRARLRDDATLRYSTAADIITDAVAALTRAQAEAPRWFTRLPDATCVAVAAEVGAMAYYTAPSPDGARSGTMYYNTSEPTMWTRVGLEAATFHESVPGHHLQLALAQALDLHPVLGELEVTSYSEGWGLYAERLADEMSLYSGPLQQLGMLTLDSLRAARLVVDTGLHSMGWTRDEAIAFLMSNTSLVRGNAEREVDRYIADPGQATSYMIGRLEIDRLRALATARLGARFSLKAFHDTVLGGGMTPLTELGRSIEAWIDTTLA
ncbi:MAG: DUF885 domain-containing protein [Actinomycetota bacterium]|nr:DUF885 domain-containing protein [Actinomycetota bacterium]